MTLSTRLGRKTDYRIIVPALLVLLLGLAGCGGGGGGGPHYPAGTIVGPNYVLIPLAPLAGDVAAIPVSINNQGQIAGTSASGVSPPPSAPSATRLPRQSHSYFGQAVLFNSSGQATPLGVLPGAKTAPPRLLMAGDRSSARHRPWAEASRVKRLRALYGKMER